MRSLFAFWLIALFSLTSISAAAQPARIASLDNTPIPFDQYWELVQSTRQMLLQLEGKPQATVREQLNGLASQWDQVTAVEMSDHSLVPVDSSYLTTELRSEASDPKRLGNLLDALLKAHEDYPQKVFTIQDTASLKAILARPEFQWEQASTIVLPTWLQDLLDRFFNFWDQLIARVSMLVYEGRYLLIVAAAIFFVFILLYISRNLAQNLVGDTELPAEGESDELLTSKGALKRAETLSMKGDYRSAIRYLYLSSLLVLDEQGLLRYDRSRTNREYLRSVSSRPELAEPLKDVINVFDRVWYGFESVDEQEYQSYVEQVEELREKKE